MEKNELEYARTLATGQIVAAFLAGKSITDYSQLTETINTVRLALSSEPAPAVPAEPELVPAISIRKSVTPDYIVCLEDGKKFKSLKRHLRTHFGLSPEDYREKWSLPTDYPMVAPNYSATRSKLAKDNGLGTKGVSH